MPFPPLPTWSCCRASRLPSLFDWGKDFPHGDPDERLQIRVTIDGLPARCAIFDPRRAHTAVIDGVLDCVDGRNVYRKLTFAQIDLSKYYTDKCVEKASLTA